MKPSSTMTSYALCAALAMLALPLAGCASTTPGAATAGSGASPTAPAAGAADTATRASRKVDHFLAETPVLREVGPDVAEQYRRARDKTHEVDGLRALLETEESASASGADAEHAQRVAGLKRMLDVGEKNERHLSDQLVATAKQKSQRSAPRVRATLGPFLANLRHAVAEASDAAHEGDGKTSGSVLALQARVLDAILEGFSHAAWAKGSHEPAGDQTATPSRSRPGLAPVVVAIRTPRSSPRASAGEVFEP